MTKLDLQARAAQIAARNRTHLDQAGLPDIELVMVSSVLHLLALASQDGALEQESGFDALFKALHQGIWEPARRRRVAEAGHQLADLADHLAVPLEAHRQALGSETEAARVIGQLKEAQDRVRQFRSSAARWQQRLSEGVQDLSGDLDHDLRSRLRLLGGKAEGRAESDAAADELEFEAWFRKVTIEEMIAHYDLMITRCGRLTDEIASEFHAFDRNASFEVTGGSPAQMLEMLQIRREQPSGRDGRIRRVVTTTQGYSSGMVLASSVFGVIPGFQWVTIVALPLAGLMARRALGEDRVRRRALRRQELKRLSSRYLDEIGFIVHKDSRDTLRRIHRDIRNYYVARAEQLDRTLQEAAASAERARRDREPAAAHEALARSAEAVQRVRSAADVMVADGERKVA